MTETDVKPYRVEQSGEGRWQIIIRCDDENDVSPLPAQDQKLDPVIKAIWDLPEGEVAHESTLIRLNDNGYSFAQIADIVEAYW